MLDKWFIEDIQKGLEKSNRFVVIDPEQSCDKLLDVLKRENIATIFNAHTEIEEFKVKYEIEKNCKDEKTVIYTSIPLDKLVWLREYCETGGRLEINFLHRYISEKVSKKLHFDLSSQPENILALGKLSIGRDKDFWDNIRATGEANIFSTEEILEFLASPERKFKSWDMEAQNLFVDLLSQHTDHSLANKPPKTVADELTTALFKHLHSGKDNSFYKSLYHKWIDSKTYEPALKRYLKNYTLPSDVDIWSLPANHPFKEVDMKWLGELSENIHDKKWIRVHLPMIYNRSNEHILSVLDSQWWKDIYALFNFNISGVIDIRSIEDGIEYYKSKFYKVDTAVRHIYTAFLSDKKVLKPIQEYYQQLTAQFLDKWFPYFSNEYSENQTGYLKSIVTDHEPPIAIIVGDAISFEVSQEIVSNLDSSYSVSNGVINGCYPSETENCMSRLFSETGDIYPDRSKRHTILQEESGKKIDFQELDDISPAHKPSDYSIFYSSDVDELSEKQNQNALKYYSGFITNVCEKIETIFGCGYNKVFLVSDHGFVLTGILEEADKVTIESKGGKKGERYYLSVEKAKKQSDSILEIKEPHKDSKYQYYSKSMNPFKTKGAYGFSHGGITPQELLIPKLMITKSSDDFNKLKIEISNKPDLLEVVGDLYQVVIRGGEFTGDAFSVERKVMLVFAKDKKEFNRSSIVTIKSGEQVTNEFEFEKYNEFDILVIDANTKSTLDSSKITRQIARDLGGLGGN